MKKFIHSAAFLKRARLSKGFRFQKEFADLIGVRNQQVNYYEQGYRSVPRKHIAKYVEVLDLNLEQYKIELAKDLMENLYSNFRLREKGE